MYPKVPDLCQAMFPLLLVVRVTAPGKPFREA